VLVLGPRRIPPVPCPAANTNTSVSVLTSVGFRQLAVEDYAEAVQQSRPDIVVVLADVPHGVDKISRKKIEKMTDRSGKWMREQVDRWSQGADSHPVPFKPAIFAPLLPVDVDAQGSYLECMTKEFMDDLTGLAVYDVSSVTALPDMLAALPKLSFSEPATPHRLLWEISQGVDIFTIPFIGAATDAGIALDFSFEPSITSQQDIDGPRPLGLDMWQLSYAVDLGPLAWACQCYTCRKHHRAYVQHLLAAKEMLGWVLLQIHNHHVLDQFFTGVRKSITEGTFDKQTLAFQAYYEAELPAKTGQGPR